MKILTDHELIKLAQGACQNAYAPYSNFKVGAAILTINGKVFTGCNVENASYGLTICAERVAVTKAVSEGIKDFTKLAVYAETENLCTPCGACRQFLAEFNTHMSIIIGNHRGEMKVIALTELLPFSFGSAWLAKKDEK